MKDTNDFIKKVKNIYIPNDTLLVTAEVVGLHPRISDEVGFEVKT